MPLKFSLTALPALLTGALLLGASLAHASDEQEDVTLQPMKLSYNASLDKGISLNGDARRILEQRDDGTWHFRTDVDSFVADIDESLIFAGKTIRWFPCVTATSSPASSSGTVRKRSILTGKITWSVGITKAISFR